MNTIKLKSMLLQYFNEDIGDGDLSSETIFSTSDQGSLYFMRKNPASFAEDKLSKLVFRCWMIICTSVY